MVELINAFLLIFIAEMGDKTQLMAMAFATKYKMKQILLGVALGASLNHGLAILLGTMLGSYIQVDVLQFIAGLLFVFFAIAGLSLEDEEEDDLSQKSNGPILTVATAFFIGELGDKTQLTAMTLALEGSAPIFILLGTTLGMVVVSLLGVIVGSKLGQKIPEHLLKLLAASIFLIIGVTKIVSGTYLYSLSPLLVLGGGLAILLALGVKGTLFFRAFRVRSLTPLQKQAQALKAFKKRANEKIDSLCLDCSICDEQMCGLGYIRETVIKEKPSLKNEAWDFKEKAFDQKQLKVLEELLEKRFLEEQSEDEKSKVQNAIEVIDHLLENENQSEDEMYFSIENR